MPIVTPAAGEVEEIRAAHFSVLQIAVKATFGPGLPENNCSHERKLLISQQIQFWLESNLSGLPRI